MTDRLPHEKGFHVSWDQLHRDARALAWRLDGRGPDDGAWKAVLAITRGGMAPAMIVARELDIRIVDTISVRSYDHQTQSAPEIIKMPNSSVVGRGSGVLVIDDLVDTERRSKRCERSCPMLTSPRSTQSLWENGWLTRSLPELARTPGSSFRGDMALQYVEPFRGR